MPDRLDGTLSDALAHVAELITESGRDVCAEQEASMVTSAQLVLISTGGATASNCASIVDALDSFGPKTGLDQPHRLAHYLARLAVESAGFHYDHELWGPTPAQKRYDTRTDLGNTAAADVDGYLYRGRGPVQITGKSNYRRFTEWARALDPKAPDFVANPDAVLTDPWEGLVPVWYWSTYRSKAGKTLNAYADENNPEMICRAINGGLNGYADQLTYYTRAGLVLLGYKATDVRIFQAAAGIGVDGDPGPTTRKAIHARLLARGTSKPAVLPEPPAQPARCPNCGQALPAKAA